MYSIKGTAYCSVKKAREYNKEKQNDLSDKKIKIIGKNGVRFAN